MEGTTEMVDQTYEFLAPVMVRWKTYNCYSFDHTAVPRFIYVREQEEQARLVMPTLVFHRGHRFTDQEVEPDACVAVKDWWFNTGFHLAYDIQSISFTSSIPFI
ncbi:hypothetical protein Bca4012_098230 [Brassica carinata]|uniref:(rape) hypothetical protein n=1 Tax=Brassica napus TaxID=3708 RepID=A0A816Q388_BRANA|nr:unnamed protein product [Brassica napus]